MKDKYERAELDITRFETEDVITTSGPAVDLGHPDSPDNQPTGLYMLPIF